MPTTPVLPMITATLNLTLNAGLILDMNQIWLNYASGPIAFLAADIDSAATEITTDTGVITVGSAILIDTEPMVVTAVGASVTVERAATIFPFLTLLPVAPKTTHTANVPIMLLQFSTPWEMLADLALRPWVQQAVIGLGAKSATFGTYISGSLAPTSGQTSTS